MSRTDPPMCRHGALLGADDEDGVSGDCDRCQYRAKLVSISMPSGWMPTRGRGGE